MPGIMPMPTPYVLALYRGDSSQWVFHFWQDPDKTQPADLTGMTALATIALGAAHVPVPCEITLPNTITLTIAGSIWATLPAGTGRWDLQLTDAAGWVTTPLAGGVSIRADVTEAAPEYASR
jgi:hypothetical protein